MGSDPNREPPFFFMKPADALLLNDADMPPDHPADHGELVPQRQLVCGQLMRGHDWAAGQKSRPAEMVGVLVRYTSPPRH
jgi:fumarylpyruvate hydrolase